VNSDFTSLEKYMEQVPDGFEYFMAKALAKNPDDRFQSGQELSETMMALSRENTMPEALMVGDPTRSETVTRQIKLEDSGSESSETTSNPNLTQVTAIDTIFQDLTSTARHFDLRGRPEESSASWLWLLFALGVVAAAVGLWFFFIR
jgi:hypothetical protein